MIYLENYELIKNFYESDFKKNLDLFQTKRVVDALYKDPDIFDKNLKNNFYQILNKNPKINFSTDGICGWKILFDINDGKKNWLEEYKIIRGSKYGEFIWPSDRSNGNQTINQQRSIYFGDRIDLTIYDIKRYLTNQNTKMSFESQSTKEFFDNYKNKFKKFCDDYGIKGKFVNEKYEVLDLNIKDISKQEIITEKKIKDFSWSNHFCVKTKKELMKNYISNILGICLKNPKN